MLADVAATAENMIGATSASDMAAFTLDRLTRLEH